MGIQSSNESWDKREGKAGYLTICDKCNIQVDFFRDLELEKEIDVKETLLGLKTLYLNENKIQKVKINGNFPSLDLLDLRENEIGKIFTIEDLPKLRYLKLGENKFDTLENLSNLPSLTYVHIDQTPVKHVRNLDLPEGCRISSFLIDSFTDQERAEMEHQIKSLGLKDGWATARDYWD